MDCFNNNNNINNPPPPPPRCSRAFVAAPTAARPLRCGAANTPHCVHTTWQYSTPSGTHHWRCTPHHGTPYLAVRAVRALHRCVQLHQRVFDAARARVLLEHERPELACAHQRAAMQPQHRPEQALCLDVGMQVERVLSALCRAFLRLLGQVGAGAGGRGSRAGRGEWDRVALRRRVWDRVRVQQGG
eukprot:46909-Chlamydomonas_euryale.AAC.1